MKRILALVLTLVPVAAMADGSLGVRAGTLGVGVELSVPVSSSLGIRLNADAYSYSRKFNQDNIDYDGKATLKTGSLLFDWYPFVNNFRISAGPMYNGNKLGLTSEPGSVIVNGTTYQATLDGQVAFKKYVPYAGIGYGRPIGTGLSLTFDLGVVFQGTPTATLTGTCSPPVACTNFQSDLKAQEASLNDHIKDFRYYPVATLGLAYTF